MKNDIFTMYWIEKKLIYKQRWSILLSYFVLGVICAIINIFAAKNGISLTFMSCGILIYTSLIFTTLVAQSALRECREDGALQTLLTTPLNPVLIFITKVVRYFLVCSMLYVFIFCIQRIFEVIISLQIKINISNNHFSDCFSVLVIVTVCSLAYLALTVLSSVLFPSSHQLQGVGGVVSLFAVLSGTIFVCHYFSYQNIYLIQLTLCVMSAIFVVVSILVVKYAFRFDFIRV
jgi:ABC-type transport system involved in cytochrome c biogenesis permease component